MLKWEYRLDFYRTINGFGFLPRLSLFFDGGNAKLETIKTYKTKAGARRAILKLAKQVGLNLEKEKK